MAGGAEHIQEPPRPTERGVEKHPHETAAIAIRHSGYLNTYYRRIKDPGRFRRVRDVGAYLG